MTDRPLTYKDAGVDIDAGDALVDRIGPAVARTRRPEVLAGLGGFGGLFALPPDRYRSPVLVSGTDGVGTKLKLAQSYGRHATIGIDLVAMCANDVVVQGAEPLFFLDYFACGRLDVDVAAAVVGGIAEGCVAAGAALIGGETAEMPDMYAPGEYDLAGFCVGVVERDRLIDGSRITPGDALVGIASSGAHSNGYSLIRRVLERSGDEHVDGMLVSERLLTPTRIYVRPLLDLVADVDVKGLAHITGGGITENVPRILPPTLDAVLDAEAWPTDPLFEWLERRGNIDRSEMRRTFNMGIGMVAVVADADADSAVARLGSSGERAFRIGSVEPGSGAVRYA